MSTNTITTEGAIWKQILRLFFPILLGTFFQQLYNTVDSVIVGHFLGKEALASVGGGSALIVNLLVGFFVGISSGATVIISQFFGASDMHKMQRAVSTAIWLAIVGGATLMIIGFASAEVLLHLIGTPEELIGLSKTYINWYYTGMIFMLVYNIGSGIFRAIGDTRRPLYFLIIGCISNIFFDLLFIPVLKLGVAGAAIATVLSQGIAMYFVLQGLRKRKNLFDLSLRKLHFDPVMLKSMIYIGVPAGIQAIMYSLSNLIIQSKINFFGTNTIAAYSAYGKLDSMLWMILSAFGVSITVFSGQNSGAKLYKRVYRGAWTCLGMAAVSTLILCGVLWTAGKYLFYIFTSDPEVIAAGLDMLHFLLPYYMTYVCIEVFSGVIIGTGCSVVPMIITLGGICLARVLWITFVFPLSPQVHTVLFSYPATWTLTSVLFLFYYKFGGWRKGFSQDTAEGIASATTSH